MRKIQKFSSQRGLSKMFLWAQLWLFTGLHLVDVIVSDIIFL